MVNYVIIYIRNKNDWVYFYSEGCFLMSTEISLADFKDMPYLLANNGKATAVEFLDVYL